MARRGKRQVCEYCGTTIEKRRDVENHMRDYHSEREEDTFPEFVEEITHESESATNFADTFDGIASQAAIDTLAAIEKQVNEFRKKRINNQLAEIEKEEALLEQDLHSDQFEPLAIIRDFVNDRLRPEQAQHKYSVQNAKVKLEAGTELLHSQFSQQVRDLREKYTEQGQDGLHRIRRLCATEEKEEKEAENDTPSNSKFGAHYRMDDRGMFVKERRVARIGKRRQRK